MNNIKIYFIRQLKEIIYQSKLEYKFCKVIKEFKQINNYQLLNVTINNAFCGFPGQLSYDFINQYENYV